MFENNGLLTGTENLGIICQNLLVLNFKILVYVIPRSEQWLHLKKQY